MWIILFLKLIAVASDGRSDRVFPKNTAVIAGAPMWFLCGHPSDQETIIWKLKRMGKVAEDLIANGSNVTDAFFVQNVSIDRSSTRYSLLKKDQSVLDDAGTYKCIRTGRNRSVIGIGSAQFIVFRSKPECQANANTLQEGDYLSLFCDMYYNGALNPVTKCSENDGVGRPVIKNVTGPGNVTVFTKKLSSNDNAKSISCKIYFESLTSTDNREDAQKADNAPAFVHQWTYRTNVLFAPKLVDIEPRKELYVNGESIRCISDGNPIPRFAWRETESEDTVSNNSVLVVNEMNMHNRTYKCTATNNRGSLSTSISIRISENHSTHDPDFLSSLTVVVGVLCAVLMIAVIAIAIKRIKESYQSSTDRELVTGPDIVQHVEEVDPMFDEQPFDGYARAGDFGLDAYAQSEKFGTELTVNGKVKKSSTEYPSPASGVMQNEIPIYDEINSQVKGAVAQPEFPVYGKVNKPSIDDGTIGAAISFPEEFPAYGKVQKTAKGTMQDFVASGDTLPSVSNTEEVELSKATDVFEIGVSPRRVIVGADGTEYMDLSTVRSLMQLENQTETSAQSPSLSRSEYAQIDHSQAT